LTGAVTLQANRCFDIRAVVLARLRGTQTDCDLLEESLQGNGWPVLEKKGAGQAAVDQTVWYTIEVRFNGSAFNSVSGARERVELVGDQQQIDLTVEAADRVQREPWVPPTWYVFEPSAPARDTGRRDSRGGGSAEAAEAAGLGLRDRRLRWFAAKLGAQDTDRQVTARTEQRARALAQRSLPGAPPASDRVEVRRARGGRHGTRPAPAEPLPSERELKRHLSHFQLPLLIAVVCGAYAADLWPQGAWRCWPLVVLTLLVFAPMTLCTRKALPDLSPRAAVALTCGAGVVLGGFGAVMAATAPTEGQGSLAVLIFAAYYVLFTGIRLLARQSSWRRVVPWLLPALLPVVFTPLPGVGLTLHVFYLEAFELDLEDIEVPLAWQMLASAKMLWATSFWLVGIAVWGYAKHVHFLVKDRWIPLMLIFVMAFFGLFVGAAGLAMFPASHAGVQARAAAETGRTPPDYYGIKPEWVCVDTTEPLAEVPVSGGELRLQRPYLMIGDAGGTAVLWDRRLESALKVPLDKLRLVPTKSARATCDE
jgi:hypothetical protein